jgi:hypothetical protein
MLIVALPTHPSSVRVRAWRKLRALGAAALKNSVYLLPYSPERLERLQWLTLEVQRDRGEATLLRVDRIENMSEEDLIRLFHEGRNADYKELADRYRKCLRGLGRRARGKDAARAAEEVARSTSSRRPATRRSSGCGSLRRCTCARSRHPQPRSPRCPS